MQIRPCVISIKHFSAVKELLMDRLSAHLFIHMNGIFMANANLGSNEYNNVTRMVGIKYSLRLTSNGNTAFLDN